MKAVLFALVMVMAQRCHLVVILATSRPGKQVVDAGAMGAAYQAAVLAQAYPAGFLGLCGGFSGQLFRVLFLFDLLAQKLECLAQHLMLRPIIRGAIDPVCVHVILEFLKKRFHISGHNE